MDFEIIRSEQYQSQSVVHNTPKSSHVQRSKD